MQILLEEHAERIFLEVASENDRALALYKSCGFKEVTVYDYYALPLNRN
jgi:ribosomal protein S18 acetylase RimI-like enzyme